LPLIKIDCFFCSEKREGQNGTEGPYDCLMACVFLPQPRLVWVFLPLFCCCLAFSFLTAPASHAFWVWYELPCFFATINCPPDKPGSAVEPSRKWLGLVAAHCNGLVLSTDGFSAWFCVCPVNNAPRHQPAPPRAPCSTFFASLCRFPSGFNHCVPSQCAAVCQTGFGNFLMES